MEDLLHLDFRVVTNAPLPALRYRAAAIMNNIVDSA
jgi:hypothetical protein